MAFKSFAEYVTAPAPRGLNTTEKVMEAILWDDADLLTWFRGAMKGVNQWDAMHTTNSSRHGRRTIHGTTRSYTLEWLSENRPDLYERVEAKQLSPHAAMVAAGKRDRTVNAPVSDMARLSRLLRKHLSDEQIAELVRHLTGAAEEVCSACE